MGTSYSRDLRLRVARAMVAGEPSRKVAATFGVSASSVMRWRRLLLATQDVAPGKIGGHRKHVLGPHSAFILQALEETSHLTAEKLVAMLTKRGVVVTPQTVYNHLHRHKLSFKKNTIQT
jgi:transposase